MWILFAVLSVVAVVLNLVPIKAIRKKVDSKLLCYISLALIALCLLSFNNVTADMIQKEQWTNLAEQVPGKSGWLWFLTAGIIAANSIPFVTEKWK